LNQGNHHEKPKLLQTDRAHAVRKLGARRDGPALADAPGRGGLLMKHLSLFLSRLILFLMLVPVHAQGLHAQGIDPKFYYRLSIGTHNSMEEDGRQYLTLLNLDDQFPVMENLFSDDLKWRQLWRIEDRGNGFVRLTNGGQKNYSLDINSDGNLEARITSDGNMGQEWKLTPFDSANWPDTFVRLTNSSQPTKSLEDTTAMDRAKRLALRANADVRSQIWVLMQSDVTAATSASNRAVEGTFELTSTSFVNGATIPFRYTGEGGNLSPPLAWKGAPVGTQSFMIICTDPDAPSPANPDPNPFVHWLILNIPADTQYLLEGVPGLEQVSTPFGAVQAANGFGEIGYSGPMPPAGSGRHRYVFTILAMDRVHFLDPNLSSEEFLKILDSSVLAKAELMGTYEVP